MDNIFQIFNKDSKTASDRARAEIAREVVENIETQFTSVRDDLQPIVDDITRFLNLESNTTQILTLESNLTELNAIYNDLSNLNALFTSLSNLNTLHTNLSKLLDVFNNLTEILNVHGELIMLNALNDNLTKLQDLHTNLSKFQALHADLSKLNTLFDNLALLTDIHGSLTAIETVNTNISDVNDLVLNMGDINVLEDNLLELLDIHANLTNIQDVNANKTNIDAVADNEPDINIVALDISNVNTLATNILNLNTIYNNLSDILESIDYAIDTVKHAQNTTSFTDKDGIVYQKGAKGWSIDAEQSASNALTSEQNASTSESKALDSEQKAEKWADEDEDVEVEPTRFSAKHHAIKAQGDLISSVAFESKDIVFTKQDGSDVRITDGQTTIEGAIHHKSETIPADSKDGDYWTDLNTGDLFNKENGTWVEIGNTSLIENFDITQAVDTNINTPSEGQILKRRGTDWKNETADLTDMSYAPASIVVTVGDSVTADYTTINDAIDGLVKQYYPVYRNNGFTAEIRLEADFVMQEQVLINDIDLRWIRITSELTGSPIDIEDISEGAVVTAGENEVTRVNILAFTTDASELQNQFISFSQVGVDDKFHFWMNVDGAGTQPTALDTEANVFPVNIVTADDELGVATKLATAIGGVTGFTVSTTATAGIVDGVYIEVTNDTEGEVENATGSAGIEAGVFTNILPYGESFQGAGISSILKQDVWTLSGLILERDVETAPDGTLTGSRISSEDGNWVNYIRYNGELRDGIHTFIIYAKYLGNNANRLNVLTNTSFTTISFDLQNGSYTINSPHVISASIKLTNNGWYKCKAVVQNLGTKWFYMIPSNVTGGFNANTTDPVAIWGACIIEGESETYISTESAGSKVTVGNEGVTETYQPQFTITGHGYSDGDRIITRFQQGVLEEQNYNGIWTINNVTANTFELDNSAPENNGVLYDSDLAGTGNTGEISSLGAVSVDRSALTQQWEFFYHPAFGVARGVLPLIACLFEMDESGDPATIAGAEYQSYLDGLCATDAGEINVLPYCGFINAHGTNFYGTRGSRLNGNDGIFDRGGRHGVWAYSNTIINARRCTANNCGWVAEALGKPRIDVIGEMSGSGILATRSSIITAESAVATNCYSDNFHSEYGSNINAPFSEAQGSIVGQSYGDRFGGRIYQYDDQDGDIYQRVNGETKPVSLKTIGENISLFENSLLSVLLPVEDTKLFGKMLEPITGQIPFTDKYTFDNIGGTYDTNWTSNTQNPLMIQGNFKMHWSSTSEEDMFTIYFIIDENNYHLIRIGRSQVIIIMVDAGVETKIIEEIPATQSSQIFDFRLNVGEISQSRYNSLSVQTESFYLPVTFLEGFAGEEVSIGFRGQYAGSVNNGNVGIFGNRTGNITGQEAL